MLASQPAAMERRLFCALDTTERAAASALIAALSGALGGVKLGLEYFAANGPEGVSALSTGDLPVFLDLKFNDIPNTVAGAVRAAGAVAPFMMTIHALGGAAMMRAAMAAAHRLGESKAARRPRIVAVTVLTSMDAEDLGQLGMAGKVSDQVRRLAALAQECGVDGIVCSAREIERLRQQCGPDFTLVVPGIRPAWSSADDQKRIVTPAEAIMRGADYLVVGRPITRASDPAAAVRRIVAEMTQAARE